MPFEFDGSLSTVVEANQVPHVAPEHATGPLSPELLNKMHRYWCAANYLTVGQIYLQENPLLREPLSRDHIKKRLLGHWGTSPGINFIYTHLNRLITERNADVICIIGPGHGCPAGKANAYLEGSYTQVYHPITQDEAGMRLFFRQFSTPGGVSSHCGAHLPGSINEGGELGYALMHAYGAAFDTPDLIVACTIGDGEAEITPG
jgi:xylulose-5-phosphate/fructose-6-phosphate phosphoketolase